MRFISILCLLPFLSLLVNAGHCRENGQGPPDNLLERLIDETSFADWGFFAKNVTTGDTIAAININRLLVPASTQKLATTLTALMILQHDHVYHTHLEYDGQILDGTRLEGNLYIRGSGDPSFGAAQMNDTLGLDHVYSRWLEALQAAGIETVNGHIIADERIFDTEMASRRWLWEDIGNYFGAGASGLTANENEYTVYFNPGNAPGDPASIAYAAPEIPGMSFINEVTTGTAGSGDQVYIFGAPYIGERHLTGTVPLGSEQFPVRGSMHDPPLFAAERLRTFLIHNGIAVRGVASSYRTAASDGIIPSEDRETLAVWSSPLLFDIIYRTNVSSVNTYAENLLKTIGHHVSGKGSATGGLQAMQKTWEGLGASPSPGRLVDGSGLSPVNRLTPAQLLHMLNVATNHPSFPVFFNSLPLAGYSGSLAAHLRGTSSEGVLRAKSGTLSNVIAYAGYTPMQNGNLAAFVLIVNNPDQPPSVARRKMLRVMDAITQHPGQ